MINFYNTMGKVSMTGDYFAGLVSAAASSCYGVAEMATSGTTDTLKSFVFGSDFPDKGVRVSEQNGELAIELHIKIVFGVNIAAIVDSIANKVKYAVEQSSGLNVSKVDVYVDEMVAE